MGVPTDAATGRAPEWIRANREAHALALSLGMEHSALSDFACSTFAVGSMSELTTVQMRKLGVELATAGAKHKRRRRERSPNGQRRRFREDNPDALPTPEQSRFVARLFDDLDTLTDAPVDRSAFVRKLLANNHPWPQTRSEAATVIEGVKGWISSARSKKSNNRNAPSGR